MSPKNTDRFIQVLSIPLGAVGVFAILGGLQAYYELFMDAVAEGFSDPLGLLLFIPIVTSFLAFGLFAIYTTLKIWARLSASHIRNLVAIGAIVLWGLLVNLFQYLPLNFRIDSASNESSLINIGSILLMISLYRVVSRWLIARSSVSAEPPSPTSPTFVGVFCLLVFMFLSSLIIELAPKEPGQAGSPELPWEYVAILLPLLVAGVLYKTILHLSARRIKRYKLSKQLTSTPV